PGREPRSDTWIVKGVWAVYQLADLMWSSKQAPFLVTETNASSIGFSNFNQSVYDGQWRQAAWALVSRGARMIEYWQWQTLHFGAETYWGGVLPHSRQPGRVYRELATLGAEFTAVGETVATTTPDADVAILFDSDSKFALAAQSPFPSPATYFDRDAYRRIESAFERGAFDAGLQVRVVRRQQVFAETPADSAAEHSVLVVAGFYIASDEHLDWLADYARAGGHLVLGPRSAYADLEARARLEVKPARLTDAAGVWFDEFANLESPVAVTSTLIPLSAGSEVVDWLDGLTPVTADTLVAYDHPHFGRWSAVTSRAVGDGRLTVVGGLPNQAFSESLFRWLVPEPTASWGDLPPSVRVTSSSARSTGLRVLFVHNWSADEVTVSVPTGAVGVTDLLSGAPLGSELALGPWDVRILSTSTHETAAS
ncbi:MAG: beta-galactosidase, partial [Frondihabitans sp.]|nr:beta-galactosidase [Frondihabitans sp.]